MRVLPGSTNPKPLQFSRRIGRKGSKLIQGSSDPQKYAEAVCGGQEGEGSTADLCNMQETGIVRA